MPHFLGDSGGFRFFPYGAASEIGGFLGYRGSGSAVFSAFHAVFRLEFFPFRFHVFGYPLQLKDPTARTTPLPKRSEAEVRGQ